MRTNVVGFETNDPSVFYHNFSVASRQRREPSVDRPGEKGSKVPGFFCILHEDHAADLSVEVLTAPDIDDLVRHARNSMFRSDLLVSTAVFSSPYDISRPVVNRSLRPTKIRGTPNFPALVASKLDFQPSRRRVQAERGSSNEASSIENAKGIVRKLPALPRDRDSNTDSLVARMFSPALTGQEIRVATNSNLYKPEHARPIGSPTINYAFDRLVNVRYLSESTGLPGNDRHVDAYFWGSMAKLHKSGAFIFEAPWFQTLTLCPLLILSRISQF